jgi:hypothetical protein
VAGQGKGEQRRRGAEAQRRRGAEGQRGEQREALRVGGIVSLAAWRRRRRETLAKGNRAFRVQVSYAHGLFYMYIRITRAHGAGGGREPSGLGHVAQR